MSNYYLLEKKIVTCSKKLKEKFEKEGFKLIATDSGWNNSLSLVKK